MKRKSWVLIFSVFLLIELPFYALAGGKAEGQAGGKTYNIVYIQGMSGNPFFNSLTNGCKDEAAKLGNVTFTYQGANNYSPQAQTPVLNAVIAAKPDAIIISPMAGEAMMTPLKQAKDAGIKLIFADTTATDQSLAASFIASDNVAGGKFAGDQLAKLIGEKGEVMLMNGTPGISTTDQRQQGFEAALKAYPGITYLGVQFCQSDPQKATEIVSSTLAAHPNLKGIYAVSTQEVEGCAVAIANANAADNVALVGFDSSPPIIEDITKGVVKGVVLQEPYQMGVFAIDQAMNALQGKSTTPTIKTPFVFLTKSSMNDPAVSKFIYQDQIK
jgi:ribose transport system substrate-binding protein